MTTLPFEGTKVLDFGGLPSGYAARLLRMMGAEVVMVEPPGGSQLRREPPFTDDFRSIAFAHYAIGRRSVSLDFGTSDGCAVLRRLAEHADVVILDQASPKQCAAGDLDSILNDSGAIVVQFRDVCSDSQWGDYVGSNLVDEALSGLLALSGAPGRPPTVIGGNQTWHQQALHALPAIAGALFARASGGGARESVQIEVSAQDAAATTTAQTGNIHQYLWERQVPRRPYAPDGAGGAVESRYVSRPIKCLTGEAVFGIPLFYEWPLFLGWLSEAGVEIPDALREPEWNDMAYRMANRQLTDDVVAQVAAKHSSAEFARLAQKYNLLCMPVQRPHEIPADEHMVHRDALFSSPLCASGQGKDMKAPFTSSAPVAHLDTSLAAIGADTVDILTSLKFSRSEIEVLIGCGAVRC